MKTFVVVEQQSGEGCDYTIGCGTRATEVQAESLDALLERIWLLRALSEDQIWARGAKKLSDADRELRELCGDWAATDERERSSVAIYEVGAQYKVPLDEWRADAASARARAVAAAKEKDERDTLAKLQKKYGAKRA